MTLNDYYTSEQDAPEDRASLASRWARHNSQQQRADELSQERVANTITGNRYADEYRRQPAWVRRANDQTLQLGRVAVWVTTETAPAL